MYQVVEFGEKRRVLLVLPHLRQGGAEASTVGMLPALCERYQVSVLLLKDLGALAAILPPSCRLLFFGSGSRLLRLLGWVRAIFSVWNNDREIIVSRVWLANFVCLLFRRKPLVVFEDAVPTELARKVQFGGIKLKLISWLYRRATKVIAVSPIVRDDLIKLGIPEGLITVVPNPIRLQSKRLREACSDRISIAFVGAMKPYKGWDMVAEAISSFGDDLASKVIFHVVGNTSDVASQLRCFLASGGQLQQHGVLSPAQIPYEQFDVVLIPSLVQESFCNVFHEALACGCYILATEKAVPYSKTIFEGYGVTFLAETAAAFGDGLLLLLQNRDRLRSGSMNSEHSILKECEFDNAMKKLFDLFDACL